MNRVRSNSESWQLAGTSSRSMCGIRMATFRAMIVTALLAYVHGAARAQPMPVNELGLFPGDAGVAPATMDQIQCHAARGGDQFLIVWTDYRSQVIGGGSAQSGMDVFGIRLDAAGNPVDPAPFVISAAAGWQQSPRATWNGENWLVTFYSQDPSGSYYSNNIRGLRVSPAGEILDSTPLMLVNDQQYAWVGGQNGQWLVTWTLYHADNYGTYLAGRRLNGNGQFIDPTPVILMDWTYLSNGNKVLGANGEYLVVGQDWYSYSYKARRIGMDGQPIGNVFTPLSPSIGTNGSEYLIAWSPQYTTNLVCSRMTSDGALLNPAGAPLYTGSLSPGEVSISHDGTNWFVGWGVSNQMRVGRVNATGCALDPNGVLIPLGTPGTQNTYDFQVVGGPNGGAQTFYDDYRTSGDANVFNIPLSAANAPGAERVVSTSTPNQRTPSFALGPDGQVALAFISQATGNDRIRVHFLAPDGQPTMTEPLVVAQGAALAKPGIAWNGSSYMVVWNDTSAKARRMNADGSFVDAAPIDVMPGFNVDVAALGADFCVTASNLVIPNNPQYIAVYYRRVSGATGALLDAAPVAVGSSYAYNARIHTAGDRWVATWEAHPTHDNPQAYLQYAFIFSDGTRTPEASVSYTGGQPDVAFNGDKHLFVWRNNSLANANNYIAGRMMNANGSWAGNVFVVSEAPGRQLRPVVGWDGTNFVVAWDDQRNQLYFFDERTDIYGARVSAAGSVLDPSGFPIYVGPGGDATAAVLSQTSGVSFVAAARFITSPPFDSYRVGLTVLGVVPVAIVSANPPIASANPFAPDQPFRDVLQTGSGLTLTQGIGAAGTPGEDAIEFAQISVTFSSTPAPTPSAGNVLIACTDSAANGDGDCPTVAAVIGSGSGPYLLTLSSAIPPRECT
ncbi:MAG TPA: hypothetical protein VGM03_22380, partial [Phycisphaerae bacterium]